MNGWIGPETAAAAWRERRATSVSQRLGMPEAFIPSRSVPCGETCTWSPEPDQPRKLEQTELEIKLEHAHALELKARHEVMACQMVIGNWPRRRRNLAMWTIFGSVMLLIGAYLMFSGLFLVDPGVGTGRSAAVFVCGLIAVVWGGGALGNRRRYHGARLGTLRELEVRRQLADAASHRHGDALLRLSDLEYEMPRGEVFPELELPESFTLATKWGPLECRVVL